MKQRSPAAANPQRDTHGVHGRWFAEALAAGDSMEDLRGLAMASGNVYTSAQARSVH